MLARLLPAIALVLVAGAMFAPQVSADPPAPTDPPVSSDPSASTDPAPQSGDAATTNASILQDAGNPPPDSLQAWTAEDSLAFQLLRQIAREDTMPVDYVFGDWVDTRDQRPTLEEILGWCIEHEKNRFASVHDISYRERTRNLVLFDPDDPKARRVVTESVAQVFAEQPNRTMRIDLGERVWDSDEDEPDVEVKSEVQDVQATLSDLPFFFEDLSAFRFEIQDRRILPDRVLYRIGFQPRSDFSDAPEGSFLVDTGDYQILRAELSMTRNVPYPIILRSIEPIVLERKKHGEVWMIDHVQAIIHLRRPLGLHLPRQIQIEMQVEDLRINEGIPDSVWVK
ncbi:MAG: hypothetical protein KC729_07005 [Candidatus Eisenbacteria bacterium]|uniref:DUF3108 domain-containing protein n=1 Tax=Eiseniibacteriota bacterium TaxID=2212470 RepID=A0A956LXX7_UNCEI|nr:hypothetical protein [Candidatus Eisenbacteria bacterium]